MRLISIVTPCFNEQDNVIELYERIAKMRSAWPQYHFEHIFIDNASTDATVERVRDLITRDPAVRLIINARNFGHIRSPYHALLQAAGDAVVCMASDLQDPPELIAEFIGHWERGARVVADTERQSLGSCAQCITALRARWQTLTCLSILLGLGCTIGGWSMFFAS